MPPYDLINAKYVLFMHAVGLGLVVLIALARGATHYTFSFRSRSQREIEEDTHEFGGGVRERNGPVPLLIWLLVAAIIVWAVGYTLYSGAYGL